MYLTFELEALDKAASVATAAKIGREWVLAGLVDMWAHCFRTKSDIVSTVHIVGFFSTDATLALEAFGFIEPTEGRWRVKGASKYLRIATARSEGGKKGRAKQLAQSATASKANARAHPGQNRALKSPQEPGQNQALKSPSDPGQNRALSVISLSTREIEPAINAGSTPQPEPPSPEANPATAPSSSSAGALAEGAELPKPRRVRSAAEEVVRKARWSSGHVELEHLRALEQFVRERNTTLTEAKRWLVELETCPTLTGRKRLDEQPPGREVLS